MSYTEVLDRNEAQYAVIPNGNTDPLGPDGIYYKVVPDRDPIDPIYNVEDNDSPIYTEIMDESLIHEIDPLNQKENNTVNERTVSLSKKANQNNNNTSQEPLTFKNFTTILSESFLGILNDILINDKPEEQTYPNYIKDILLKEHRPLFLAVIMVVVSLFFIFFSKSKFYSVSA